MRDAAGASLKALGNVSLRICDPTRTRHDSAEKAIEKILPYVCKKVIFSLRTGNENLNSISGNTATGFFFNKMEIASYSFRESCQR